MAEETNTVVPSEPAVPGDAPQVDAQATPEPVAPATAEAGDAPDAEAQPQGDGIRDKEAYLTAQAEKFKRLFEKAEAAKVDLEKRLKDRQDEESMALRQQNEALQSELQATRQEIEKERLTAVKLRIGVQHGLSDELALRLVGDTEEAIAEDAQRLSKAIPATRKPAVGNPAASDGQPSWVGKHRFDPWTGE